MECINNEIGAKTFGECLNPLVKQLLESGQSLELTRFELAFPTWQEQHCAVAYYLKNEHRINTTALLRNITRVETTGETPVQVWLRFRSYYTDRERDIMVGQWCRKYGWHIQSSKIRSKQPRKNSEQTTPNAIPAASQIDAGPQATAR
jgi:hypothetical protein